MKKYDVDFPIAGVLHFCNVEAESIEDAVAKCYKLVDKSKNPIVDFEGEWEMYEKIAEGNILCVNDSRVDVREVEK